MDFSRKEKNNRKKYKNIKKKTTFSKLYEEDLKCLDIFLIIGAIIIFFISFPNTLITVIHLSLIFILIISIFALIAEIIIIAISKYRQTKLPLTKEELANLNIESIDDYANFLYKYLFHGTPKDEVLYLITVSALINFKEECIQKQLLIYSCFDEQWGKFEFSTHNFEQNINTYFSYDGHSFHINEENQSEKYCDPTKLELKTSKSIALDLCLEVFNGTKYEDIVYRKR